MAGTGIELPQQWPETLFAESATPKLTQQNSVRNHKVICLQCGAEFRQLTQKHLLSQGMSLCTGISC